MAETKPTGFRIKQAELAKLDEMAEFSGRTRTAILELGINVLHRNHLEARREGEERGKRALELLAELRRRIGDLGVEDGEGIAFSDSGPIAVEAGGTTYVEGEDGQILATRAISGRHEMAIVGETGLSDWMVHAPAEPSLN